jgi:hypothetical protein
MGFLQLPETISNVRISIDAEEVSGSNPLSPTFLAGPLASVLAGQLKL